MQDDLIRSYFYPSREEIDAWVEKLWQTADTTPCNTIPLPDNGIRIRFGCFHMNRSQFIRFEMPGMNPFFGIWSSAIGDRRPLVVHTPGYGAELSFHPDIAQENYNVLELSPLGYWTPDGDRTELYWKDEAGNSTETWPVLPNTVLGHERMDSYFGWMLNVICAVRWAMQQPSVLPDRVSFFGTSQGGGASLLLGSIFAGRGTHCVCADEPYLTDYPLSLWRGAYGAAKFGMERMMKAGKEEEGWHNIGFVDTVSHAHRMNYPVLLTAGGADELCPPETVESLFARLDTDKVLYRMKDRCHGYQYEFDTLVRAWLRLYA